MNLQNLTLALFAFAAVVNIASLSLWFRLLNLVRSADQVLSFQTASMYTSYLFAQVMDGRFFRAPTAMALGNAKKDPVIRKVTGSSQYETVAFLASFVKDIPVNIVPHIIWRG